MSFLDKVGEKAVQCWNADKTRFVVGTTLFALGCANLYIGVKGVTLMPAAVATRDKVIALVFMLWSSYALFGVVKGVQKYKKICKLDHIKAANIFMKVIHVSSGVIKEGPKSCQKFLRRLAE